MSLGNYYVYFSVSWVPETVYHRVKLDITTKPTSGFLPISWWTGKAIAEEVFENYATIFNCNIYEANFYDLVQQGIQIDHHELDFKDL